VTNLVGNALAHTPRDGRVTVEVTTRGHDGVVEVADTGTGIAPDDLDRIFDRFYRGDDDAGTDRPARAGRGIGLTIARSLARAHGGDVTATSPGRGAGATFRLTVPVDGPTTSGHPPRG
jgi:signal transduction histidine kinase